MDQSEESFDPVWFHRTKYMLSPQLDLYRNIAKKYGAVEHGKVLDYGCGLGIGTVQFAGRIENHFRVPLGWDQDKHAIGFARSTLGSCALFECVNVEADEIVVNVNEATFDLITCIEVIEHTPQPEVVIGALAEMLKPGGSLVISTKNTDAGYRKNVGHRCEYNPKTFQTLLSGVIGRDIVLTDFTLTGDLEPHVTPMVATWKKP